MYRTFYNLGQKPFELTPDGNLLYISEAHREALATLRYGVISDKGFLMLTGGVGTGKTTIINALLRMLKSKVKLCILNNPTLSQHEFYHYLSKKLDIHYGGNKGEFIIQFSWLLTACHRKKEKVLLIIDEAQIFPVKLLEEIRLLSNQAGSRNVLSIFLIGQPELQKKLAHPRLLPLRQRIGIRYHLSEFTRTDTEQYIHFRLNAAGAQSSNIFTNNALKAIHEASHGNPRLINIICDHALITGFSMNMLKIDQKTLRECLEEIRLPGENALRISDKSNVPKKSGRSRETTISKDNGQPSRKKQLIAGTAILLATITALLYVAYDKGWLNISL